MEDLKTCNACFVPKERKEFSKQSSAPDGLKYQCKTCCKRYYDNYYAKNAPKVIKKVQKWQSENPLAVVRHKETYKAKTEKL